MLKKFLRNSVDAIIPHQRIFVNIWFLHLCAKMHFTSVRCIYYLFLLGHHMGLVRTSCPFIYFPVCLHLLLMSFLKLPLDFLLPVWYNGSTMAGSCPHLVFFEDRFSLVWWAVFFHVLSASYVLNKSDNLFRCPAF